MQSTIILIFSFLIRIANLIIGFLGQGVDPRQIIQNLIDNGFDRESIRSAIYSFYNNDSTFSRIGRYASSLLQYLGAPEQSMLFDANYDSHDEVASFSQPAPPPARRVKTSTRISKIISWIPAYGITGNSYLTPLFQAAFPCTITGFRWNIQSRRIRNNSSLAPPMPAYNQMSWSIQLIKEGDEYGSNQVYGFNFNAINPFGIGDHRQGIINGFLLNHFNNNDEVGAKDKGASNISRKLLHNDEIIFHQGVFGMDNDEMQYVALIEFFVKTK